MVRENMFKGGLSPLPENPKINQSTHSLMDGRLDTLHIDRKPTIIDLPGLSPDFKDEDLFAWAEKEMGVLVSKEQFSKLDDAYQRAKIFLLSTLKYSQGEINVKSPGSLKSKADVVELLRNIRSVKGGIGGLDQSAKYCRLVKATKAIFETKKHDADFLKDITEHFENSLVLEGDENTPLHFVENTEKGRQFMIEDSTGHIIMGVLSSRHKEMRSIVLRFLNRPESNAATALADGTGVQIMADKMDALRLIPILQKWFIEKMGISSVDIENDSFFSQKQINQLRIELTKKFSTNSYNLSNNKPNDTSGGSFKSVKIKGNLEFSDEDASIVNGVGGLSKPSREVSVHARAFEIQLVVPDNKNEEEESDHNIYDAKKCIAARTRLDGWCPASAFDDFVEEAHKNSGINKADILYYLLGRPNAPIVEVKEGGKLKYYTLTVCERFKELGFLTKEQFATLEAARGNGQKKYKKRKIK